MVDLPGVQDGNATRVAVTESYMKECAAILIVTPIARAADDLSARKLLNDAFKKQLRLDGSISNIAVVCTKTDEISGRVDQELGLTDRSDGLLQEIKEFKEVIQQLGSQKKALRRRRQEIEADLQHEESEFQKYFSGKEHMMSQPASEDSMMATRKRKYAHIQSAADDKANAIDINDIDMTDEERSENQHLRDGNNTALSTQEDGQQRMRDGLHRKSELNKQRKDITEAIDTNELELEEVGGQIVQKQHALYDIRIKARNEYCEKMIGEHVMNLITVTDQTSDDDDDVDNAAVDHASFDRDRFKNFKLPVFCICSNAYQQLQGRDEEEERPIYGFPLKEDTQIPQLRSHCREIAVKLKTFQNLTFFTEASLLLNSLKLWILSNVSYGEEQSQSLDVKQFSRTLLDISKTAISSARTTVDHNLYQKLPQATSKAIYKSADISNRWSRPVNKVDRACGGLASAIYRSVVAGEGRFMSLTSGLHDFNRDLAEPFLNSILPNWENVFCTILPSLLQETLTKLKEELNGFLDKVRAIGSLYKIDADVIYLLEGQIGRYSRKLANTLRWIETEIRCNQKGINRKLIPKIRDSMRPIYQRCQEEYGRGRFRRIKSRIESGIRTNRSSMYKNCAECIENELDQMIDKFEQDLFSKVNEVCTGIEQDCIALQTRTQERIADEQRPLKEKIKFWITSYEADSKIRENTETTEILNVENIDEEAMNKRLQERAQFGPGPSPRIKRERGLESNSEEEY